MNERNWLERARTSIRSMGVGAVATATDLATLSVLTSGFGLSARVASVPALTFGIAIQFFGNKLFAFEDRSKRWGEQAALFLLVEILGFAANLVLFDFAVTHVRAPYLLVRLVTTNIVYFTLCLPLWSRIFRAKEGVSP